MTNRPHDALFKAAFEAPENAAGLFRAILPPTLVAAVAWDTVTPEPGSFVDPKLVDRHSDLLFSARLRDAGTAYLYLLLEHQSTNHPDMPLRTLVYLVRIWERHRKQHPSGLLPPIIPAVVSHAPEGWTAPRTFHEQFGPILGREPELARLVPDFELLIDDLASVDDLELRQRSLAAFPKLALWLLRDARDANRLLQQLDLWADGLREVLAAPSGFVALAQLLRYVALIGGKVRFDDLRAKLDEQLPEAKDVAMTIAEELRQEGRQQGLQQGLQQGRQEGRQEGLRETLAKLLQLKFADHAHTYAARIEAASTEQLERYIERILPADTIDAVFADE